MAADESKMKAAEALATQFATHYYTTFDSNRAGLATLYHDQCILRYEGSPFLGKVDTMKKLESLPFQKIQHIVTTVEGQPTIDPGAFLINILGQLKADDDPPHSFTETFYVVTAEQTVFILNQVFRLFLHNM